MGKKTYEAPEVTKVEFDYSERIAADSSGGSGDVTPDSDFGSGSFGGGGMSSPIL